MIKLDNHRDTMPLFWACAIGWAAIYCIGLGTVGGYDVKFALYGGLFFVVFTFLLYTAFQGAIKFSALATKVLPVITLIAIGSAYIRHFGLNI